MNLLKLGVSIWIIILNVLLLSILLIILNTNTNKNTKIYDNFMNYPQQVNPSATVVSNPAVTSANNNYASILMFIQNNPSKSAKFITDIKSKFFDDTCKVKNIIDFKNLAEMPNGMPFTS